MHKLYDEISWRSWASCDNWNKKRIKGVMGLDIMVSSLYIFNYIITCIIFIENFIYHKSESLGSQLRVRSECMTFDP